MKQSKPKFNSKKAEVTQAQTAAFKEIKMKDINYKNTVLLKNFLSSRFKILSAKLTTVSAKKQRAIKNEIKKARIMGLLPFTDRHALR